MKQKRYLSLAVIVLAGLAIAGCKSQPVKETASVPVMAKTMYDTKLGFKIKSPPNGPWYQFDEPADKLFVFGKERSRADVADGTTFVAEVYFGKLIWNELNIKNYQDALKYLESSMRSRSQNERFESVQHRFELTKFKTAQCMTFEQMSFNDKWEKSPREEKMSLSHRGLVCLHPHDQQRYISVSLSQRVPSSKKFADLSADERTFYAGLYFLKLKKVD